VPLWIEKSDWFRRFVLGLMFAIISVFVGFNIYDYWWLKLLGAIIAGVISFVLAGWLKLEKISNRAFCTALSGWSSD